MEGGGEVTTVFVIGNEAGDLDSIVSSLLVAHLHNNQQQQHSRRRYQAVMPFPASQFRLRRDAVELFKLANWEFASGGLEVPAGLVFIDHVDLLSPSRLEVILTDANKPGSHLNNKLSNLKVVGIYDHHRDEGQYKEDGMEVRVVDETAGSCCSVVLHHHLATAAAAAALPANLAVLALGCILLDTRNMNVAEKRFTAVDEAALACVLQRCPPAITTSQMYDKLTEARSDVSHLSLDELLLLDYKQDGSLGFATLLCSPKLLPAAEEMERAMCALLSERHLHVVCAVTSPDEDVGRAFFLLARDATSAHALTQGLTSTPLSKSLSVSYLSLPLCKAQSIPELGFGMTPMMITKPSSNRFSAWMVRGALSRKTMLPAMLELMSKIKL